MSCGSTHLISTRFCDEADFHVVWLEQKTGSGIGRLKAVCVMVVVGKHVTFLLIVV